MKYGQKISLELTENKSMQPWRCAIDARNDALVSHLSSYHELHEDGRHANTVPWTHALEDTLTGGWLGSILLLDGTKVLQHLHLGVSKIGLHVRIPEKIFYLKSFK